MKVKKWTSLLLASAMVFSLTACGNSKDATADISGANVDTGVNSDLTPVDNGVGYLGEGVKMNDAGVGYITPDNMSIYGYDENDLIVYDTNYVSAVSMLKESKAKAVVSADDYQKTVDSVKSDAESVVSNSNVTFEYNGKSLSYPMDLNVFLDDGWCNSNKEGDAAGWAVDGLYDNENYTNTFLDAASYHITDGSSADSYLGYSGVTDTILSNGIYYLRFNSGNGLKKIPFKINNVSVAEEFDAYEMFKDCDVNNLSYTTFNKDFETYEIYNDSEAGIDVHDEVKSVDELKQFKNGIITYSIQNESNQSTVTIKLSVNQNGDVFDCIIDCYGDIQ